MAQILGSYEDGGTVFLLLEVALLAAMVIAAGNTTLGIIASVGRLRGVSAAALVAAAVSLVAAHVIPRLWLALAVVLRAPVGVVLVAATAAVATVTLVFAASLLLGEWLVVIWRGCKRISAFIVDVK
ncbi:unnamed protein product [Spirodela intermedia]|uniref:Uncharacterized protein n=1 Tax=Spirodela intermedia TaxID=51605 RepID=A0A7I8JQC5_SPIIN|nr:unnamed protein product [Spirodela intermedia]CAA6672389.1 unnamed protein product [Spirodela intermedia]